MSSLIEATSGKSIGIVESVGANAITVLLDPEAPQATALNTGTPAGFPRINGYLLIPNESGATVGIINFVRVERTPYPKRKGVKDFGLVDLPFPSRIVTLTPIGTLNERSKGADNQPVFEMRRGVDVFPSVGDKVLLPTGVQLSSIVVGESEQSKRRVPIGLCPTAASQPVYVDPNRLFGRHVAVLGNTGAGKSCTVAGLIRWSLQEADAHRVRLKKCNESALDQVNARFIVLDPNGEYAKAFKDLNPRVFQVGGTGKVMPLEVPAWLWNGEEWAAFTAAAAGVQRPILFDALRLLRSGVDVPEASMLVVIRVVHVYRALFQAAHSTREYLKFPGCKNVSTQLKSAAGDFERIALTLGPDATTFTGNLRATAQLALQIQSAMESKPGWIEPIRADQFLPILDSINELVAGMGAQELPLVDENAPIPFRIETLPHFVSALGMAVPGKDVSQFVDTLNVRIRGLLAPGVLSQVAAKRPPEDGAGLLLDWLNQYLGDDLAKNGPLAVIDLSLVPHDALHVIVAVIGRMVFEAIQRHRREVETAAPTVLVLDEAHTFVHRDLTKEGASAPGRTCCRTFERIAREGRKFGLGLVLASQRPHEVSPTVLSQCNTFLLHRIVNEQDQSLVRSLVPDGLGELLRELPSLPSRRAIMLGWAAPAPVLVEVRNLPEDHRPKSPDPEFWETWTGEKPCKIDWETVAEAWAGTPAADDEQDTEAEEGPPF